MSDQVLAAIQALIRSILDDENHAGGLLSRETLRLTALLYQAVITPP